MERPISKLDVRTIAECGCVFFYGGARAYCYADAEKVYVAANSNALPYDGAIRALNIGQQRINEAWLVNIERCVSGESLERLSEEIGKLTNGLENISAARVRLRQNMAELIVKRENLEKGTPDADD